LTSLKRREPSWSNLSLKRREPSRSNLSFKRHKAKTKQQEKKGEGTVGAAHEGGAVRQTASKRDRGGIQRAGTEGVRDCCLEEAQGGGRDMRIAGGG